MPAFDVRLPDGSSYPLGQQGRRARLDGHADGLRVCTDPALQLVAPGRRSFLDRTTPCGHGLHDPLQQGGGTPGIAGRPQLCQGERSSVGELGYQGQKPVGCSIRAARREDGLVENDQVRPEHPHRRRLEPRAVDGRLVRASLGRDLGPLGDVNAPGECGQRLVDPEVVVAVHEEERHPAAP